MGTANEYTLEFLPAAFNDMIGIISAFLMLESKQGAIRIKEKFNKAAEQVLAFPYSGMSVPDAKLSKSGFRMIVVEKYLMFYKVFEEEKKIVFYRILNGKTDYPTIMQNIKP